MQSKSVQESTAANPRVEELLNLQSDQQLLSQLVGQSAEKPIAEAMLEWGRGDDATSTRRGFMWHGHDRDLAFGMLLSRLEGLALSRWAQQRLDLEAKPTEGLAALGDVVATLSGGKARRAVRREH